jgi:creatinine amidohydrolase/Fe(II)-dependent formamide hydrolase-like protein
MIQSFSLLKDSDVKALVPDVTLMIFPVGGLEQHGPHLPMGTKILQCKEWVELLAKKLEQQLPTWNFIIMPVLPFTVDTYTTTTALTVRPHVMRDALVDQCDSLKRKGFTQFAALTSHRTPKQLSAIEDAAKIVSRGKKVTLLSLSSAMVESKDVFKSPMIALPEEHGGAFDTGFVLATVPELVSAESKGLVAVESPRASAARFIQYFRGQIDGYWGNPAVASAEHTKQKIDRELDLLVEKMKPVLEKGKGKSAFFSSYRYIPFNGSFFKAYLLALMFFMTIFMWMMWGVKNVFE